MADPASPLSGAAFDGYVQVAEAGPRGMITLRGDLAGGAMTDVLGAAGLGLPGVRRRVAAGDRAALWFAPDEVLVTLPRAQVADTLAAMRAALGMAHALVVDVSDARAVFTLRGAAAREVLAKLCPADLHRDALPPGEVRRTRAAQAAVAFWLPREGLAELVCFRSMAQYVFDILCLSATRGGEAGVLRTS